MSNTTIKIDLGFDIEIVQEQCDEMISCYIPAIDSYFSASTFEEVGKIGSAMIKSFINYWKIENNIINRSELIREQVS